jgi:hypothetical protein
MLNNNTITTSEELQSIDQLIHMKNGFDYTGLRLEPTGEFTDKIIVTGLM